MNGPGRVSIVIPCFNQGDYVAAALNSVLGQTVRDFEIVLVNDGSTDDTGRILAEWAAGHPDRITVLSQPNRGLALARQAGLERARAEHIVFLDADDTLRPRMLEACLEAFARWPRAGAVVGATQLVYENAPGRTRVLNPGANTGWPAVLAGNPCGACCSVMLKRDAILRAGGAGTPGVRACEDWDLYARMARCGVGFRRIGETLSNYLQHERALSQDIDLMLREKLALLDRLGRGGPAPELPAAQFAHYRNGHILFALGEAVGRRYESTALEPILSRMAGGALDFRFFSNQFLYGMQHTLALEPAALPPAYIDRVGRQVQEHLTRLGFGRGARLFVREIRREMRHPLRRRSLARRLSRLLDPLRWLLGPEGRKETS